MYKTEAGELFEFNPAATRGPSLNRSALESVYLQCVTSALECVPSALNVKLVVCICTGKKCVGVQVQLFKWGRSASGVHWECAGSALICICKVHWSALGVCSLTYLECVGVHCSALGVRSLAYLKCIGVRCSAPGVRSLAYLECVHLHMRSALECIHLSLRFASGLYQYHCNYEIEKYIIYSLNSYRERSVNCWTETLNYKYHIVWPCPCITSSATPLRFVQIFW